MGPTNVEPGISSEDEVGVETGYGYGGGRSSGDEAGLGVRQARSLAPQSRLPDRQRTTLYNPAISAACRLVRSESGHYSVLRNTGSASVTLACGVMI